MNQDIMLQKIVNHVVKRMNDAFQYSDYTSCEEIEDLNLIKQSVEMLLNRGFEIDKIVDHLLEQEEV
jgi:hypothetical protein